MVWRVSSRATFKMLRQGTRGSRCGPVSARFTTADVPSVPRVGYAVGRRVGNAVARNRLRRRMRAAVSELTADLRPGAYLVSVDREACGLSYEELKTRLARAMTSASQADHK
ncbi:MAG: ribonuclease P protein component [Acidimicrobiales bacterium]